MSYGQIESVKKTSSDLTTSFKIMACNNGDASWTDITDYPLGWFRPFTDYNAYATWATSYTNAPGVAYANVAIYLTEDSPVMPTTGLKGLTDPTTRTDCLYDFTIINEYGGIEFPDNSYFGKQYNSSGDLELSPLSSSELASGVTIYGYGSDAYLALLDATGGTSAGGLVGQQETWVYHDMVTYSYYTQYSWMESLFGTGTSSVSVDGVTHYYYWSSQVYDETSDTGMSYTDFTLGYYTAIPGYHTYSTSTTDKTLNDTSFLMIYEYS